MCNVAISKKEESMTIVLIIFGLAVLLWIVLSFRFVDKGMLQLPLRGRNLYQWGNPPQARGIEEGWYFFWLGPFIKFISIEKEQNFQLDYQFLTAAPRAATVKVRIKLNFSLTGDNLPYIWRTCNGLSYKNLEIKVKNLLLPLVKRIGQGLTLKQLKNDLELMWPEVERSLRNSELKEE